VAQSTPLQLAESCIRLFGQVNVRSLPRPPKSNTIYIKADFGTPYTAMEQLIIFPLTSGALPPPMTPGKHQVYVCAASNEVNECVSARCRRVIGYNVH